MNLLIIGGTQFVGRHVMEAALSRGERLTVFNRGVTASALPPGVEWIRGDRRADLSGLSTGRWDAVIDTCGYLPGEVARMAEALDARVGRYVFVSSVSAYASSAAPNREDSPLGRIHDEDTEVVDGRSYGPLKAACERVLVERFGRRALLVRPGLVVGPNDPTQRFTWWPARVARALLNGLPMLAPGEPERRLQFIDARDLAEFILHAIATDCSGPVNAVAPAGFTTMGRLLQACGDAVGQQPKLVWATAAQLQREGIAPWVPMPLWLPAEGEHAAFMEVDTALARQQGLRTRALHDTVSATLAWWRSLPADQQRFDKAGLTPEREAQVLARLAADR